GSKSKHDGYCDTASEKGLPLLVSSEVFRVVRLDEPSSGIADACADDDIVGNEGGDGRGFPSGSFLGKLSIHLREAGDSCRWIEVRLLCENCLNGAFRRGGSSAGASGPIRERYHHSTIAFPNLHPVPIGSLGGFGEQGTRKAVHALKNSNVRNNRRR